jgi:hypothetical protein
MEPTKKGLDIEFLIDLLAPKSRRDAIRNDTCAWCGDKVTGFRDELSRREYRISGFCQRCQDATFGRQ